MPRTAREIFKSRGYTDEQLNGIALLQDHSFVSAIEAEEADRERLIAENARHQADLKRTEDWYKNEANPKILKSAQDVVTARKRVAELEEQLKAEQETGLRRVAVQEEQPIVRQPSPSAGSDDFSRLDSRYVSQDTLNNVTAAYGSAIAMASDIVEDHRDLFGKRLPGGVGQLRSEYGKATETGFRGNLRDYWENKYSVSQRRADVEKKDRDDHERKIAEDAVRKYQSENLNPMTRTPDASRNPFMRKGPPSQGDKDNSGRQPWDKGSPEQRRSERVVKFGTKALNSGVA